MSPSKKHPLEVFRGLQQQPDEPGSAPARVRPEVRRERPQPAEKAPAPPAPSSARAPVRRGERGPGDFKVTLTLNQVLVGLLAVTVLVLGGYFAGYYNAKHPGRDSALSSRAGEVLHDPALAPESPAPAATGAPEQQASGDRWGLVVGTWDEDRESLVDRTRSALEARGYKQILKCHYELNRKFALIVGSFESKDDPDLKRLQDEFRAIKDFPGGDPAPFVSAYVIKHPKVKS